MALTKRRSGTYWLQLNFKQKIIYFEDFEANTEKNNQMTQFHNKQNGNGKKCLSRHTKGFRNNIEIQMND